MMILCSCKEYFKHVIPMSGGNSEYYGNQSVLPSGSPMANSKKCNEVNEYWHISIYTGDIRKCRKRKKLLF